MFLVVPGAGERSKGLHSLYCSLDLPVVLLMVCSRGACRDASRLGHGLPHGAE